jgi:hypothetical protein
MIATSFSEIPNLFFQPSSKFSGNWKKKVVIPIASANHIPSKSRSIAIEGMIETKLTEINPILILFFIFSVLKEFDELEVPFVFSFHF